MKRFCARIILLTAAVVPVGVVAYWTIKSGSWLPTAGLIGVVIIATAVAWASDNK